MADKRRGPIGIELVKEGLIDEFDINRALEYQKDHPSKKITEILSILELCDEEALIEALGHILDEKAIILKKENVSIRIPEYISMDVVKSNKAIPFEINGNKVKVCFADTANKKAVDTVRLILLNKGLLMERYITFEKNILEVIASLEGASGGKINAQMDTVGIVDNIIKNAMQSRASDIHIEPLESEVRVRYRVDGELITTATLPKEKQPQIVGRIKAISNMFQEKLEDQDGRILSYSDYNIRVSSQNNVYGEKFVLRLLKKNTNIVGLKELGFPGTDEDIKASFNKKNSITIVAAPTGSRKNNYSI